VLAYARGGSHAHGNHPRSISRLHDDELSCVLPFLELKDLAQLVRCSRRFNTVARKERSRGLQLEGGPNIAPLSSSALSHHISSLHLAKDRRFMTPLNRDVLRQLRDLSRLTALQLTLYDDAAVGHFMRGLSRANAAAALRAVLPTRLRSFSVVAGSTNNWMEEQIATLASSFGPHWAI
jgi:hypothetical protein